MVFKNILNYTLEILIKETFCVKFKLDAQLLVYVIIYFHGNWTNNS